MGTIFNNTITLMLFLKKEYRQQCFVLNVEHNYLRAQNSAVIVELPFL
jgi:hypothetical protein